MSGIEREMTLPCGEQVMPFHEQGVELEGFHEERTEGDDDFAAGRRERRACPSGERQVTPIFVVRVRQKNSKENNKVVTLLWGTMFSIRTENMAWFWRLRTWSNGVLVGYRVTISVFQLLKMVVIGEESPL